MFDWRSKIEKKEKRKFQTTGRTKSGSNCKATPTQKFFAKRSRSYKHPGYYGWCRETDKNFNLKR